MADPLDPFFGGGSRGATAEESEAASRRVLERAQVEVPERVKEPAAKKGARVPRVPWVPDPHALEKPVEIEVRRQCHFKKKPEKKRGCARCGEPKNWDGHVGIPPSFNAGGSGGNHFIWQNLKGTWERLFAAKLTAAGLPLGLRRITVEGLMCFPDRGRRDQGNFRVVIEKALGDALVDGGWLEDDDWDRYEFGNLQRTYEKGVAYTRLMLFPSVVSEEESRAAQGTLL